MNERMNGWKCCFQMDMLPVKGILHFNTIFIHIYICTLYPFICSHSFGLGLGQATNRKCCMKQQTVKWKIFKWNSIHVCMYVCVCKYICTCVYVCVCLNNFINVYLYLYLTKPFWQNGHVNGEQKPV